MVQIRQAGCILHKKPALKYIYQYLITIVNITHIFVPGPNFQSTQKQSLYTLTSCFNAICVLLLLLLFLFVLLLNLGHIMIVSMPFVSLSLLILLFCSCFYLVWVTYGWRVTKAETPKYIKQPLTEHHLQLLQKKYEPLAW
jgi:hypothetical protein